MPKMHTKRAVAKRILNPKAKKWTRHSAYTSHLAASKTTKQKRHLRQGNSVSESDYKRLKRALPYNH